MAGTTQTPRLLSEITSNGEEAFPWKLHRLLEESERCGFTDIVSWQGNRHFKMHDPKKFEQSIVKKFFNQTRYKSFQRQRKYYCVMCDVFSSLRNQDGSETKQNPLTDLHAFLYSSIQQSTFMASNDSQ
jgi:hypothetical protein